MDDFELEQLRKNPLWASVLDVYHQLCVQSRNQLAEFDGWVPRVHQHPEIAAEVLSGVHGKLIAFGFLKFDLAGRDGGIRYQLTPLGKQGLNGSTPTDDDDSEINVPGREELIAIR